MALRHAFPRSYVDVGWSLIKTLAARIFTGGQVMVRPLFMPVLTWCALFPRRSRAAAQLAWSLRGLIAGAWNAP